MPKSIAGKQNLVPLSGNKHHILYSCGFTVYDVFTVRQSQLNISGKQKLATQIKSSLYLKTYVCRQALSATATYDSKIESHFFFQAQFVKFGGTLQDNENVVRIHPGTPVCIETSNNVFTAQNVIVTAGLLLFKYLFYPPCTYLVCQGDICEGCLGGRGI